jgi:opacity protein-like surface antigen
MKKLLVLAMMATLLMAGSAFAGINSMSLTPLPDATAPAPITRTAHLMTVKNLFGWNDALEGEHAKPGEGFTTVDVEVTNCHGAGPLPDPLKMKAGQTGVYDGNGTTLGFNGAQCVDPAASKIFAVVDLVTHNGAVNLVTRAEYKTSIGKDLFDIPELPDALAYGQGTYEFSRVWNGYNGQSAFLAFVNVGDAGNVTLTAIEDTSGAESAPETIYLQKGDTFQQMATKLKYGRVRITVPPLNAGCPGCTPGSFTPKIYVVIFRGYNGAGVAKAIAPELKPSL